MDVSPPDGSFLFLWASERSGFMHLYLYQYVPGAEHALEIRQITSGEWVVESVVGVDQVRSNPRRSAKVCVCAGSYPSVRHDIRCRI